MYLYLCVLTLLRTFMNIIALKLITGEDVMGDLETESETEYVINNPVSIAVLNGPNGQPGIGLGNFPMYAESVQKSKDATITLAKKYVVYYYTPAQDFLNNYNQVFGSGILLPPKKPFLTKV